MFLLLEVFFIFFIYIYYKKNINSFNLEIILTFISFIIIFLCYLPSIEIILENDLENNFFNIINVNIFGYQWYWNYYISNFYNYKINFDSNLNNLDYLFNFYNFINNFSENNNRLILPIMNNLFFITLSDNVIHSWFIPELNIKLETNPGFINFYLIYLNKLGIFYGNCAEICGLGHSFIPINLEIVTYDKFLNFYNFSIDILKKIFNFELKDFIDKAFYIMLFLIVD